MRLAQHTPKVMSAYSLIHSGGALLSATPQVALSGGLVASLSKWSVTHGRKELPVIPDVKSIHVYDFDNTLFLSPLPNPKLWSGATMGQLQHQEAFTSGGWWHNSAILAATGDGIAKEEVRAWEGWWNELVVSLVELSMAQRDTLKILLTGRSVKGFSELIQRIVATRNLEFDMICLKPEVGPDGEKIQNTKQFKTMFLSKVMDTYVHVEDLKIYEDRLGHVHAFEQFFQEYNERMLKAGRREMRVDIVQVASLTHTLHPVTEVSEIQKLINEHNMQIRREGLSGYSPLHIKKQVFFTGYLLPPKATKQLLERYPVPQDEDIRVLASNIMITPRRANQQILHKVGGLGNQVEWEIIGTGCWQDRVWAALVRPVDNRVKYYTDNPKPVIVLAHRRGAKPLEANLIRKWQDVEEGPTGRLRFITKVDERILLKIESEEESLRMEHEWKRQQRQHPRHHFRMDGDMRDHPYHHNNSFHGGDGGFDGHGKNRPDGYHGGGVPLWTPGSGRGRRRNYGYDDRRPSGGGGRGRRQWD